ncbi:threonine synthase [Ruminococcaceae bacterium OttesenSCG-928-O06]|nr:threonine synthase [Ruminococcaceae bacterium OttesenSCG-928-O06]
MQYESTRDSAVGVSSAQAILTGLSPDGGLFVPKSIPQMDFSRLKGLSYPEVAFEVLRVFLTDYDEAFLRDALAASYGAPFGGKVGQIVGLDEKLYCLELWHGPTAAFKDYALQLMPKTLAEARKMLGETGETIILVATSGDTGGAALAGYSDVPGIKIAVFYPNNGTSELQRLQMTTQEGRNVAVYAVHGNFDDAQRGVKAAFTDKALAQKLAQEHDAKLSSANSINWGRLVPQIVYYVTSYLHLWQQGTIAYGDEVDFCVPTGNFGDIMAGWYAKQMGLPIGRLICASNKNNVLADFLQTGRYDSKRAFHKTSSPSMDILVSSNLERLLYHATQSDAQTKEWMEQLAQNGSYTVDAATLAKINTTFTAGWAAEDEVFGEIRECFAQYRYLCDPHTAVALQVYHKSYARDGVPTVVLSTASPFKFAPQVLEALGQPVPQDEFAAIDALQAYSGAVVPPNLANLSEKAERFTDVMDPETIVSIPLTL